MTAWFGEPWWSYVCYDEAGRLLEAGRVPFPEGIACMWCEEPFALGDSGEQVPAWRMADSNGRANRAWFLGRCQPLVVA